MEGAPEELGRTSAQRHWCTTAPSFPAMHVWLLQVMDKRPQDAENHEALSCDGETSGCPMERDAVRQPAEAACRSLGGRLYHSLNRCVVLHMESVSFCCFTVGKQWWKAARVNADQFLCHCSPPLGGESTVPPEATEQDIDFGRITS